MTNTSYFWYCRQIFMIPKINYIIIITFIVLPHWKETQQASIEHNNLSLTETFSVT